MTRTDAVERIKSIKQVVDRDAKAVKDRAVEALWDRVHTHLEIAARAFLSRDIEVLERASANAHVLSQTLLENIKGSS